MTRRMTLVNFDRTPIRPTNRIHPTAGGTREMTQNFIYYPRYAGEKATALVKMYIMSSNLLRTLSSVLISDRGKQQTKEKAEERKRTQKGPVGRQVTFTCLVRRYLLMHVTHIRACVCYVCVGVCVCVCGCVGVCVCVYMRKHTAKSSFLFV